MFAGSVFYSRCKTIQESTEIHGYIVDFEQERWLNWWEMGLPRVDTLCNYPANICLFKVNNRNSRKRCEICSKLTIKTPERRH